MDDQLYVVGGQQRELRPMTAAGQHWYEYQRAIMLEVDTGSGEARLVFDYVSPSEVGPADEPTILFKSGTRAGDLLYLCTQTEVIVVRAPEMERVAYLSLPAFNDVHHVRPSPSGSLLIANTGLDSVMEVSLEGDVVREWNVFGGSTWDRFSRDVDYRKVRTTKPHLAHPNHVFYIDGQAWATRFEQRDAVAVDDLEDRIEIGLERLHDGLVSDDKVYFTTVDGKVVIADTAKRSVVDVIDLTSFHPADTRLGWCRGIHLDGDRLWVGFSRIRPTKFRENVGWVLHGFKRDVGTHIACYDLAARACVKEIPLEDAGMSAVFSIFAKPGAPVQ
ncbi:MAG: hypothetical protein WKF78_06545 [Candidatus Limnocylindrales bacterium]